MNPNNITYRSQYASSIVIQNKIIQFKIPIYCAKPHFMVRSFGTNVNFFKKQNDSESMNRNNTWISFYPIIGRAVVDITLVTCDAFNISKTSCILPKPVVLYRGEIDFGVWTTLPSTNIWIRDNARQLNAETRYQKGHQCSNRSTFWTPPCNLSPIDAYTYAEPTFNNSLSICFLGASHTQYLYKYSKRIGMKNTFDIRSRFAKDIVPTFKLVQNHSCEYVVLHTGQWDLGYPEHRITPQKEYELHLDKGMKLYKNSDYKLYVVSNNYNPLGNAKLACLPTDWRRPDFIDAYNNILQKVAKKNGFPYIDNNYEISGVAWDSASDWCHYDFKVMKAVLLNTIRHFDASYSPGKT